MLENRVSETRGLFHYGLRLAYLIISYLYKMTYSSSSEKSSKSRSSV